jgi:hypothetical protein
MPENQTCSDALDAKAFRARRAAEGISGRAVCTRAKIPRPRLSEIEVGHVTATPSESSRLTSAMDDLVREKQQVERFATDQGLCLTGLRFAILLAIVVLALLPPRVDAQSLVAHVALRTSWAITSNLAVGGRAVVVRAGTVGVRHVVSCVSFSAVSAMAGPSIDTKISLRDGATTLWSQFVRIPAANGIQQEAGPIGVCGLNLIGSDATAMTLEFSTASNHLLESVNLSGYELPMEHASRGSGISLASSILHTFALRESK